MTSVFWTFLGYSAKTIEQDTNEGAAEKEMVHEAQAGSAKKELHDEMTPLLVVENDQFDVKSLDGSTPESSPNVTFLTQDSRVTIYTDLYVKENTLSPDSHHIEDTFFKNEFVLSNAPTVQSPAPNIRDNKGEIFEFPCTYNTLGDMSVVSAEADKGGVVVQNISRVHHIVYVQDTFYQESTLENVFRETIQEIPVADEICLYFPSLNPIGSSFDRAIQLFHFLKGEICFFGHRTDQQEIDYSSNLFGTYPEWDENNPVSFVCVGFGGNTVRELLYLLDKRKIPRFVSGAKRNSTYNTSLAWVSSIVCIASPFCGIYQSESLSDSFLCDSFTRYFALKYVGFLHLLSTKCKSLATVNKLDYYSLGMWDCMNLTTDVLNKRLAGNHIFAEIKIRRSLETCRTRYSRIARDKMPRIMCVGCVSFVDSVSRIPISVENPNSWLENDGVVPSYSQKYFFGPDVEPHVLDFGVIVNCEGRTPSSFFSAAENYEYLQIDGLSHADVTDHLEVGVDFFDKLYKIQQLCRAFADFIIAPNAK